MPLLLPLPLSVPLTVPLCRRHDPATFGRRLRMRAASTARCALWLLLSARRPVGGKVFCLSGRAGWPNTVFSGCRWSLLHPRGSLEEA